MYFIKYQNFDLSQLDLHKPEPKKLRHKKMLLELKGGKEKILAEWQLIMKHSLSYAVGLEYVSITPECKEVEKCNVGDLFKNINEISLQYEVKRKQFFISGFEISMGYMFGEADISVIYKPQNAINSVDDFLIDFSYQDNTESTEAVNSWLNSNLEDSKIKILDENEEIRKICELDIDLMVRFCEEIISCEDTSEGGIYFQHTDLTTDISVKEGINAEGYLSAFIAVLELFSFNKMSVFIDYYISSEDINNHVDPKKLIRGKVDVDSLPKYHLESLGNFESEVDLMGEKVKVDEGWECGVITIRQGEKYIYLTHPVHDEVGGEYEDEGENFPTGMEGQQKDFTYARTFEDFVSSVG